MRPVFFMANRQINVPAISIDGLIGLIVVWLRRIAVVGVLLALVDIVADWYGLRLPFLANPGHVALAYCAGVLYLTK